MADETKARGDAAFSAGRSDEAIEHFSQAPPGGQSSIGTIFQELYGDLKKSRKGSQAPPGGIQTPSAEDMVEDSSQSGRQVVGSCTIPPLRPDVRALGFKRFDDMYDPTQLLCCYAVRDNAVEILFFHVEGMATLIGVGLPNSCVRLRKDPTAQDLTVEVLELQRQVWLDYWSMAKSSILLLDFTKISAEVQRSQDTKVWSLSAQQAAEQLGIGVEGENLVTLPFGAFESVVLDAAPKPPPWIGSFYHFLRAGEKDVGNKSQISVTAYDICLSSSLSQGEEGLKAANKPEKEVGNKGHIPVNSCTDSLLGQTVSLPPSSSSNSSPTEGVRRDAKNDGSSSSQGKEGLEVEVFDQGKPSQPLQLTVIIYLNSENVSYYSGEIPLVPIIDVSKDRLTTFVSSRTDHTCPKDPLQGKCVMVPIVTVTFSYNPHLEGHGSKKMTTTLEVKYCFESSISDPNTFGWYHDEFQLSFKCSSQYEVRSLKTRVLSETVMQTATISNGKEVSTQKLRGKSRECGGSVGYTPFGNAHVKLSSEEASSTGETSNQALSSQVNALLLKDGNLSISNLEGPAEMKYLATILFSYYLRDVWNPVDRVHLKQSSGMMSSVPIQVEGDWVIREDGNNFGNRNFCKYTFICQRNLNLLRREGKPMTILQKFFRQTDLNLLRREGKPMTILQKLECDFRINHSFSHMKRLERPHPYEWHMVDNTPCPELIRLDRDPLNPLADPLN
ncbi:hypothetical protein R1flu_015262 [Riccia fluitans]|uniref:Uncharacterized protein n=1 Tax=Riccia fluitans TaxID=41844 RepID=A0ABD1YIX0_9MARC